MHSLAQALWGNIWKCTLRKSWTDSAKNDPKSYWMWLSPPPPQKASLWDAQGLLNVFFLMLRQRWKSMKKLVRKNIILRQFWKLGFKTNSSCKQLHRPLILFVSGEKWTLSTDIHIQPHPSTSKLWKVWIFSKIWMVFGKKFPTNTNTNTIRFEKIGRIRIRILFGFKKSPEYEYEY